MSVYILYLGNAMEITGIITPVNRASGIYETTTFAFIDDVGTLGIAYFSFKEGKVFRKS